MIASQPKRGDRITIDGRSTEALSQFMSDITEILNRDVPRNNYTATTNPTTLDNASQGYTKGSEWINTTTDKVYKLTSFTGVNATWSLLN